MHKIKDYSGKKFLKITTLRFDHVHTTPSGFFVDYWVFKCFCGKEFVADIKAVKSGKISSCGCLKKEKDIAGVKFNKLTAIKSVGNHKWLFKCECGKEVIVNKSRVVCGYTKSCGCLVKNNGTRTHNMTKTRIYKIWNGIKRRCMTPTCNTYKNYGAKGIIICDEWKTDFLNFYNWSICNGYNDKLTIDRINNKLGYSPQNCRWVDYKEQERNKEGVRIVEYCGKKYSYTELACMFGIDKRTLYYRVKHWKDVKRALTEPLKHHCYRSKPV